MDGFGAARRPGFAVVIAGGGTGGHLYPGIAVARELLRRMPEAKVSFAGTAQGLEARVVPREGFELDVIRSAGLKGKSAASRLRGAALVLPGLWDAWRIVSRRRPAVVVGVGGYSSGPVVLAAALRRRPTIVLEQNAVPGFTNRLLAPVVRAAAVTYQETLPFFRGRGVVTGNPVRQDFFASRAQPAPAASEPGRRLLILGGSQGAHAINVAAVAAASELARRHAPLTVVHQTGERDATWAREQYAAAGVDARAEPFLDPVAPEVLSADLVVSRAGATTLAELAAAGRPTILVPFPAATDDHQRRNARVFSEAGAAVLLDERDLTGARLAEVASGLIGDRGRLDVMSHAMRTLARPDAAGRIVDCLLQLARGVAPAAAARDAEG
jgi:UDP-N-acetylglucosamine--N-acetylmuramyl-(pentapeptide) pyrophosphoryl-undecaprenol N-acetylglucosamine transferase